MNVYKCETTINTAIIIPYRDRLSNLQIFLNNMHRILTKQKINYGIFLVEPILNTTFNRGILMNIGFKEAISREYNLECQWNCFIFHGILILLLSYWTVSTSFSSTNQYYYIFSLALRKMGFKIRESLHNTAIHSIIQRNFSLTHYTL